MLHNTEEHFQKVSNENAASKEKELNEVCCAFKLLYLNCMGQGIMSVKEQHAHYSQQHQEALRRLDLIKTEHLARMSSMEQKAQLNIQPDPDSCACAGVR